MLEWSKNLFFSALIWISSASVYNSQIFLRSKRRESIIENRRNDRWIVKEQNICIYCSFSLKCRKFQILRRFQVCSRLLKVKFCETRENRSMVSQNKGNHSILKNTNSLDVKVLLFRKLVQVQWHLILEASSKN